MVDLVRYQLAPDAHRRVVVQQPCVGVVVDAPAGDRGALLSFRDDLAVVGLLVLLS